MLALVSLRKLAMMYDAFSEPLSLVFSEYFSNKRRQSKCILQNLLEGQKT